MFYFNYMALSDNWSRKPWRLVYFIGEVGYNIFKSYWMYTRLGVQLFIWVLASRQVETVKISKTYWALASLSVRRSFFKFVQPECERTCRKCGPSESNVAVILIIASTLMLHITKGKTFFSLFSIHFPFAMIRPFYNNYEQIFH